MAVKNPVLNTPVGGGTIPTKKNKVNPRLPDVKPVRPGTSPRKIGNGPVRVVK